MAQGKRWIVQKYGGTSLGKLLQPITESIVPRYLETHNVAVVCSAISGTVKSLGTTSLLLLAIEHALTLPLSESPLNETIDTIRDQHLKLSNLILTNVDETVHHGLREKLHNDIVTECEQLRGFLLAAQVFLLLSSLTRGLASDLNPQTIGELSPTSKDRVVATGEKLACRIVVAALISQVGKFYIMIFPTQRN
jgi:aspartate kinase